MSSASDDEARENPPHAGESALGRTRLTSTDGRARRPAASSTNRQTALTRRICATVAQSASSSAGAQTSTARHCARDVATLNLFGSNANPIPRGASSLVELAIETKTTGACCPWNLSTVPTATASGSRACSIRTCAL